MSTLQVARPPSSAVDPDGNWQNLNNISADDNVYATCLIPSSASDFQIIAYNFGFSVSGTINGISVKLKVYASVESSIYLDYVIFGFWNGTSFTPKGNSNSYVDYWHTTDNYIIIGSSSDLWGTTWTPDDINNPQFGISIYVNNDDSSDQTAYIDYVEVTITYTPPAGSSIQLTASVVSSSIVNASLGIQKILASAIHSSTSFLADLIIRGKVFLNTIISTSTAFISDLKVNHTLASVFAGKTQIIPFASIKKALQGSFAGKTLFAGTISGIKRLASNIATRTILTANFIAPRLLSAVISSKTTFTGQMLKLKNLVSQVIGKTTIQAQFIRIRLLKAIVNSTTQMGVSIQKTARMSASFVSSTTIKAISSTWHLIKKPTATWKQKI
ncbi:MAG: hypothetical protein JHC30_05990 [Caldisericum sp.]|jgi:hypothetical protein|nr:hypothetical protein [Caldisericum sp.]